MSYDSKKNLWTTRHDTSHKTWFISYFAKDEKIKANDVIFSSEMRNKLFHGDHVNQVIYHANSEGMSHQLSLFSSNYDELLKQFIAPPKPSFKSKVLMMFSFMDDITDAHAQSTKLSTELVPLPKTLFLEKVALLCVDPKNTERTFGDIAEIYRSEIIQRHKKPYANFWYSIQLCKVVAASVGPLALKILGIKEVIEKFSK